jgi:hypothetical protein
VINWGITNSGDITFNLNEVGISYTNAIVTDLWTGNNSTASGSITVSSLPPYGNAALRISKAQQQKTDFLIQ